MKITTFKLFQVTIILSVLILLTIARNSHKSIRKNKVKKYQKNKDITNTDVNNQNNLNKDPIAIAYKKCKQSCDKDLIESKNKSHAEPDKIPIKNEFNLYTKKKDEDLEYYLCECLLSNNNVIVQKDFYFANKSNVEYFLKNDDDGKKVYKKKLKKQQNNSQKAKYELVKAENFITIE